MAGASADGEMNYWPGFVDALANLVLALVFVVVIFTLALAVISSKVGAKAVAKEVARAKEQGVTEEKMKELSEEVKKLQSQLAEKDKLLNLQARSAPPPPPAPEIKQAGQSAADVTFTYDPGSFELGPDALSTLDKLMKSKGSDPSSKIFNIVAYPSSGAFSAEKRSAYYRMVALRNLLIERGVPADNIKTKTVTDAVLPGLQGQVRLSVTGRGK